MDHQPSRFVEHEEKLVFEDDVDGVLEGHKLSRCGRLRHLHLDGVAAHQGSRGTRAFAVDGDGTVTDQSADLRA